MIYSPLSSVGQVQGEVEEVKRSLYGKANTYELSALSSRMDRLESALLEIRTALNGLRVELSGLQESLKP